MNKLVIIGKIFVIVLASVIPDLLPTIVPTILQSKIVPYDVRVTLEELLSNPLFPWQTVFFGFFFAMANFVVFPGKMTMQDVFAFILVVPLVMIILTVVLGFTGNILTALHLRGDVVVMAVFTFFVALCTRAGLHLNIGAAGVVCSALGSGLVLLAASLGIIPGIFYQLRFLTTGLFVGSFATVAED